MIYCVSVSLSGNVKNICFFLQRYTVLLSCGLSIGFLFICFFQSWSPEKLSCIISLTLSFPELSLLFNFRTSTHQILDSLVWSSNFQLFYPIVHTCLLFSFMTVFQNFFFLYYYQTFIFSIHLISKCSFLLSYFLEQLWETWNKFLLSHIKNFM